MPYRGRMAEERYLLPEETDEHHVDVHSGRARTLHQLRMPGSSETIDHIAVAESGVYVIERRRYLGAAQVHRRLRGPAKLTIDGVDQSELIERLTAQVETVRSALAANGFDVPVHGAFWFLETEFPPLGKSTVDGLLVCGARGLFKRLSKPGAVSEALASDIAGYLAETFPTTLGQRQPLAGPVVPTPPVP